jgi:hypothetical protein
MLAQVDDIGLVSTGPGGTVLRLTLPQTRREPQAVDAG